MPRVQYSRTPLVGIALFAFAAVGAALVSQHRFGMQPCPWCILQRLIFVVIGLVALIGAVLPRLPAIRWPTSLLVVLLSAAGISAALWQNLVASKSTSCNFTLADKIITGSGLDAMLPEVFEVRASCADAAVSLLGLPYEMWSLIGFVIVAVMAISALRGRR